MREIPKNVIQAMRVIHDEWCNESDLAARLDYYRTMKDPEGANKLMTSVVLVDKWLTDDDISDKAVETAVADYWA
jgi:hypothetical protein